MGIVDPRSDTHFAIIAANAYPQPWIIPAYCQPYYLRHDYLHLMRGEVKPFLRIFYNQMAAMQDRETYTHGNTISAWSTNPTKKHGS